MIQIFPVIIQESNIKAHIQKKAMLYQPGLYFRFKIEAELVPFI